MHTSIMILGILVAAAGATFGLGAVIGNIAYFYHGLVSAPLLALLAFMLVIVGVGAAIAQYGYRRASLLSKRLAEATVTMPFPLTSLWLGLGIMGVLTHFNLWGADLFNDTFEYPIVGYCFAFVGIMGLVVLLRHLTGRALAA